MRCCRQTPGARESSLDRLAGDGVQQCWRYAFSAIVRKDPAFNDPAEIEASKRSGRRWFAISTASLPAQVATSPETPSLAAIPIACSVQSLVPAAIDRPRFADVEAYYGAAEFTPGFQRHGRMKSRTSCNR